MNLRVLTVADLHQSGSHYRWLRDEVEAKRPDVVAFVGDVLSDPRISQSDRVRTGDAAELLSNLPCPQLVFVRGNHEQEDWPKFVAAWPLHKRPLVALSGTVHIVGPLVIVGFPCHTGWEEPWYETLPKVGNEITRDISLSGRKVLPAGYGFWLSPLIRRFGPAASTLWLMHEPPQVREIARPYACNPRWTKAVKRFRPLLTVSGHDHHTPMQYNTWHGDLGATVCVNVGRGVMSLHYCVLNFEFPESKPCLPTKITVEAFPWKSQVVIQPKIREAATIGAMSAETHEIPKPPSRPFQGVAPGIYKYLKEGTLYERPWINGRRTWRSLGTTDLQAAQRELRRRRGLPTESGCDSRPIMKAVLEFNLPEAKDRFDASAKGLEWKSVVAELDHQLDLWIKERQLFATPAKALHFVRQQLHQRLAEKGLRLG